METLSPNDRATEVAEKVQWRLDRGVRLVWVIDPEIQAVTAHHPGGKAQLVRWGDTLEAGEVVPRFALPLSKLFE